VSEEKKTNPYTTDLKATPQKSTTSKSTGNPYKRELVIEQGMPGIRRELFEKSEKRNDNEQND